MTRSIILLATFQPYGSIIVNIYAIPFYVLG